MRVSQSRGAVDAWTPAHVVWGGMLRYFGASAGELVALGLARAVLEHLAAPHLERLGAKVETPENAGMDIVASLVGWKLSDAGLGGRQ